MKYWNVVNPPLEDSNISVVTCMLTDRSTDLTGIRTYARLPTEGKRTFDMLSKFNNEVLSYGPTAVLPQNLNRFWIKKLQKAADEFLDNNFDLHECRDPHDIGDPILSACVYEILAYQCPFAFGW